MASDNQRQSRENYIAEMNQHNVAIVGATGMVGRTFINLLAERSFPVKTLRLFASQKSKGEILDFNGDQITVDVLTHNSFTDINFALFSAGADVSKTFAPAAVAAGATVIDNSSAFRMDEDVPLVVPEVNPRALDTGSKLIANPNCSTIQMVMAVKPLHDLAVIKRIVVSTYQAVSGTGKDAVQELQQQSKSRLHNEAICAKIYPHQIAFNMLPHIDVFCEGGHTNEELKMVNETRKILEIPQLPVSATCVRVPVYTGHSLSLNLEFEKSISVEAARNALGNFPGVVVLDEPEQAVYPTPAELAGRDEVFVGRIRQDDSIKHGLNLWVVADNLRKGAALNAIQIAELLVRQRTKGINHE